MRPEKLFGYSGNWIFFAKNDFETDSAQGWTFLQKSLFFTFSALHIWFWTFEIKKNLGLSKDFFSILTFSDSIKLRHKQNYLQHIKRLYILNILYVLSILLIAKIFTSNGSCSEKIVQSDSRNFHLHQFCIIIAHASFINRFTLKLRIWER